MRCKYIRKIFQNEENGYTVALFSTLNQEVPLSARDKFWAEKKIIAFTAKGYDLPLTDEIEIEMEGEWETSSYGTQYKVETFLEVVPRTREGILGYLSCGSLKGIGPKTAERIVNRFGLDTLEVMEKYPQELLKIQGISQQKLDRIVDSFGKNKVFRELMTFLSPFHVTPKKANMILQKFRDQSVEIIRKQPYILCAVKGFGFLTVDAIARQCCAATNDPMRISGCVSYVLREAMKQNGHLYLEQEILVKDALKVLNKEPDLQPVTETEILKVIYRLVMQDSIVVEENRIYITKQYQEEDDTASMIARKLYERIPVLTIEKELEEAQKDLNITLSEQQKEAVRMVFANPISIITGGPGTGKTTVLNILGGMDTATEGKVLVDGKDVAKYTPKMLTWYRRDDIGFVFQFYNLVPNLTALENVELALQICKEPLDAKSVLEDVGLGDRLDNFPAQLSGGEQQRVSIARALAKNPKLLLCDEPTGALDYNTGKAILKLLQDTCRQKGMTVIVITHNSAIAPMADRIIHIKNGRVSGMELNPNPVLVETIEW